MAKRQNRVELKGSARASFSGAHDAGPADPNQQMEVTVFLRRGSKPGAFPPDPQMSTRPPRERKYLTREEFASQHGASAADFEKVRAFASQHGLQVLSEDAARRTMRLSGTVKNFNDAFGVSLRRYEHTSGTYHCRTGTLTVPADLESVIEGVFGLDNRPQAKPHFRLRKKNPDVRAQAAAVSYSPLQVAQAYAFPSGASGSGQCIGVIELGGGYNAADLNSFFGSLGIQAPKVTSVSVDGATNSPSGDPSGADGEVELDIEVAAAIAPGAEIAAYFAPNTDQGFIDAVTTAVHDATLKPSIISISWGGPENSWTEQSRNALNSACQDGAAMGVTVLAASGDSGASDGSTNGAPTVDFPAASPYVLGCGGTRLTISGTSIKSEQAWNELSSNEGATGGGVSEVFALPSYQQSAKVPKAANGFVGRGVPDVAGDADPETGYNVVVDGEQTVIGGTSAVAPLWAGLLALINQSLGANVGYVNALLYAAKAEATFHDITSGSNGGYSAGPGWDACTGLGSPDGAALLAALKG
ncbi:MAG TPA: S53 family peptidase [Candidatus Acidoferrales bacterium]|jgi:kumamolisin|nr:S53 family peptidase [Candidatus Acidoferrales bacterium]